MNNATAVVEAANTIKQKQLDALIDRLNSRLNGINECVNILSEFRHRLLSPKPAEVSGKSPNAPSQPTIEGRLSDSCNYASIIQDRLQEILSDLNSAA